MRDSPSKGRWALPKSPGCQWKVRHLCFLSASPTKMDVKSFDPGDDWNHAAPCIPNCTVRESCQKSTVDGSLNHFDPPWIIRLIHQTTKTSGCTPKKMDEPRQWKIYKKKIVVNFTSWCIERLVVSSVCLASRQSNISGWNMEQLKMHFLFSRFPAVHAMKKSIFDRGLFNSKYRINVSNQKFRHRYPT